MNIFLRRIWNGDLSKRALLIYVVFISVFFLGGLLILMSIQNWSLRNASISFLGDPNLVPDIWWIFSLLMIMLAIFFVPIIRLIPRIIPFPHKFFQIGTQIVMSISAVGLIGVGIINQTVYELHIFVAVFAFGGMGLALLLSLPLSIYSIIKKTQRIDPRKFIILLIIIGIFFGIMINELLVYGIDNPQDLNFLEWTATFMLFVYMNLINWASNHKTTLEYT